MPSTIPYDPSLTLGNVVHNDRLKLLQEIQDFQRPIDEAENELNSAILLRRSLDMTLQELDNLGISTDDLKSGVKNANDAIRTAASKYASEAAKGLKNVADKRQALSAISVDYESPIDYVRSQLKDIPLAADSIRLNAQYFSFSKTSQRDNSKVAALKAFVAGETSFLGTTVSAEMSSSALGQVNAQRENHDVEGTLVITATCTHRMSSVWAPFVIDVDKAIRVWNKMKAGPPIKIDSRADLQRLAEGEGTEGEPSFNVLSGVTFGSSFVGMVHALKMTATQNEQSMYSVADSLQAQMKVGNWYSSASGGLGVASSFANSAKALLSQATISSHVSMVAMGVIPSVKAKDVVMAVKQFSEFSPQESMAKLATLQNATVDGQKSLAASADAARTGATMVSFENSKIQAVLSAVAQGEEEKNRMLDINSLMEAFEDFVNKAAEGKSGVPINYYLKPITGAQLAQMWIAKYLPGKYIPSGGDDAAK